MTMAWIKVTEQMPPEKDQTLAHKDESNRVEFGQHADDRWHADNLQDGQLNEIAEVTHRGWILDSEMNGDDA
jgi:hypothetical protein